MNAQQRKYAKTRVEGISRKAIGKLRNAHTVDAKNLSGKEKYTAWVKGEWVHKEDIDSISLFTDVLDLITFDNETTKSFNHDSFDKESGKIERKCRDIVDSIMLADAAGEVLEMISGFNEECEKIPGND